MKNILSRPRVQRSDNGDIDIILQMGPKHRKARIDGGVIHLTDVEARHLHANLLAGHPCGDGTADGEPVDEYYAKDCPQYNCQMLLGGSLAIRDRDLDEFTDDLFFALEPEQMTDFVCDRLFNGDDE